MKKRYSILFIIIFISSCIFYPVSGASDVSVDTAIDSTAKLFLTQPVPVSGTVDGEWKLIGLIRSGVDVPKEYMDAYYDDLCRKLREADGELSKRNYSEYSRATLGVTVIGKNAGDVGGYDLIAKLADYKAITRQTINNTAWALTALDCNRYDIPEVPVETLTSRSALIQHLLDKQLDDGGWAVFGTKGDIDVTSMVLTSIAGYYDENLSVKQAADRAAKFLSENQNADGGYTAWNITSSESISQVITALCSLGIDPKNDSRFIKNGKSLIDALLAFYSEGGGFAHLKGEGYSQLASEQGLYALAAYKRLVQGKTALFDMRDIFKTEEKSSSAKAQTVTVNSTDEKITVTEKYTSVKSNEQTTVFELRSATALKNTLPTEPVPETKRIISLKEPASAAETQTEGSNNLSVKNKKSIAKKNSSEKTESTAFSAVSTSSPLYVKGTSAVKKVSLSDKGSEPLNEKLNTRRTAVFAILSFAVLAIIIFLFIGKKRKK